MKTTVRSNGKPGVDPEMSRIARAIRHVLINETPTKKRVLQAQYNGIEYDIALIPRKA